MADSEFVKGFDDLIAGLKDLAPNLEAEANRMAMFRAAQLMREKIQAAAPISNGDPPKGGRFAKYPPGSLKKSIKAKRRRGKKGEAAASVTGAFYAKWIEFGHVLKGHKPDKQILGHIPPNPFVRHAVESNQEQAIEIARKGLLEAIQKRIGKLSPKGFWHGLKNG